MDLRTSSHEFAPKLESLRQLARELRKALFSIKDGALFTGTFRDVNIMYDDDKCIQQSYRSFREGGTGNCISEL
jgi:hypothetical protein